jgi:hypothetical protein
MVTFAHRVGMAPATSTLTLGAAYGPPNPYATTPAEDIDPFTGLPKRTVEWLKIALGGHENVIATVHDVKAIIRAETVKAIRPWAIGIGLLSVVAIGVAVWKR